MRLPVELGRRQALTRFMGAAALWLTPMGAPAADEIPTFSLKGLKDAVTGADAPRPEAQLGVIGRGKDGTKSGLLNFCDKKGCVSTFAQSDTDNYIPPWTYQPGYSTSAASSYVSPLKQQLLEEAAKKEAKPLETAFAELLEVRQTHSGGPGAGLPLWPSGGGAHEMWPSQACGTRARAPSARRAVTRPLHCTAPRTGAQGVPRDDRGQGRGPLHLRGGGGQPDGRRRRRRVPLLPLDAHGGLSLLAPQGERRQQAPPPRLGPRPKANP